MDKPFSKLHVKYLDPPIKSENDKKEYRVIKLKNGLTALLISDFNFINNEESSVKKTCTHGRKLAAAALCINVGSFSDPPQAQGLAHLLEHVIPAGSAKYPQENEYERFVKGKGGSIHAETGREQTKFGFQVQPEDLLPALDRFANFFAASLLRPSAISRERECVDNEFYMDSASDCEKLTRLFRIFFKSEHPASKFSCGNLITLPDDICEELRAFKRRHYSAHRMTLALQATLPLGTLENYVRNCFVKVPAFFLPPSDFTEFCGVAFLDNAKLTKLYKIKSAFYANQMELKWILPPSKHLNKSKPLHYIAHVMNHTGSHSLSYYLRTKKLCHKITAIIDGNSIFTVFKLSLILFQNEDAVVKKILEAVFSYINFMKRKGPEKKIFNEMQRIAEYKFRFADELDASTNVHNLCENMQLCLSTDYITCSNLHLNYDPKSIQYFLTNLTPDNVIIAMMDKSFDENELEEMEPYHQIRYSSSPIPKDWISKWREIDPFPEFDLPGPNKFIATDFGLVNLPIDGIECPVKIEHNGKVEIWYKPDYQLRLPKCFVYFHIISALSVQSLSNFIMLRVFVILLNELMSVHTYDAKCAGLDCDISESDRGVFIRVDGFSQKVPILLNILMNTVANFQKLITEDLFNVIKLQLLKYYSNALYDPEILANEIQCSLMELNFWISPDKYSVLSDVKFDQFVKFTRQLFDKMYIRCLVQGNVTVNGAIKIISESTASLKRDLLFIPPNGSRNMSNYIPLPFGEKCCRIKNLNPRDVNSVVFNYYSTDTEISKMSLPVFNEFFQMFIQEPLFHQLRTTEQLGYSVSFYASLEGFNIVIISPAHKYTTEYVDKRIRNFLKDFIDSLKQMTDQEFNDKKQSFNRLKECADICLKDEVDRNWFLINTRNSIFNEIEKQISAINSLTINEFQQWIQNHIEGGKNWRKLSVQIEGNIDSEYKLETKETQTNDYPIKIAEGMMRKIQLDYNITDGVNGLNKAIYSSFSSKD